VSFGPSPAFRKAIARQPKSEEDRSEDPQDMGHETNAEEDERY